MIRTKGDLAPMKLKETRENILKPEIVDKDPLEEIAGRKKLVLPDLINIALQNSPETRITWAQARAAAAGWGKSRSSYYPTLETNVGGAAGRIPQLQGGRSYFSADLALDYLLLDFGGRSAKAEAARQALIAANWNHNQAIQDLLRDVPKAYYNYIGDISKVRASEISLREARTTLSATEERKRTGAGTIVDVLQARASKASVEVELVSNRGEAKIAKGSLATTVGWPANTPFDVMDAPSRLPLNKLGNNVDDLIADAKRNRAAIASSKASVKQREAELLQARALPFPKITGGGNATWERMRSNDSLSYYGTFNIEIPLFKGFEMRNSIREARAELVAARAQLKLEEEQVIQEVWNAYNNFKTASEQLRASNTLLRSSRESYNASLARYRKGAADIVELLNAQSLLASARSQVIDSRMGLYTSYAELVHAVGS